MGASQKAREKNAETVQLLQNAVKQGKMQDVCDLTGIAKDVFQGILKGQTAASNNQRNKIKDALSVLNIG